VIELTRDQLPAAILSAHEGGGGDPHIVEEGRADVVLGEKRHRLGLDAGRLHVDDEHGDAGVLGSIGIRSRRQPDVVGVAGQTGEDLLAVDHVLVTVALGPRRERREIGAGAGFGVADAEMDLAGQDAREEERLLLFAAVSKQGGTHGVDRQHRHRSAGPHGLVEEDELLDLRTALAPVLFGPADAEPAVPAHLSDDRAHRLAGAASLVQALANRGREQLGVVRSEFAPKCLLLRAVGDVHAGLRWAGGSEGGRILACPALRVESAVPTAAPPRDVSAWFC